MAPIKIPDPTARDDFIKPKDSRSGFGFIAPDPEAIDNLLKDSYTFSNQYLFKKVSHLLTLKEWLRSYSSSVAMSPVFKLASSWPENIAITDQFGDYSYRNLFVVSKKLAGQISNLIEDKTQERVSFLCPNNASYVLTQWACWISGQIAVPLSSAHPVEMLEYFIRDSDSRLIISTKEYEQKMEELSHRTGVRLFYIDDDFRNEALTPRLSEIIENRNEKKSLRGGLNPNIYSKSNAMILYTSGTTSQPKGVVLSYENLWAQVKSMLSAWGWTSRDSILHTLPLHHIHGIVNGLLSPLYCGARCIMLPKFNAKEIWKQLLSTEPSRPTVLTGVPTMYVKLIEEFDKTWTNNNKMVYYVKAICSQNIRLMMCGSASLPETIFNRWEQITGHRLLERYGMTEIGMALSNPLNGHRQPGFVGQPLPGISVRIVEKENVLVEGNEFCSNVRSFNCKKGDNIGELQIKGANVFKEYWKKPEVTKREFTNDGWFKTGDTAELVGNSYRILGRLSVDIIKSGGYKISALFIESALLEHPNINDVAVIGVPDSTWGQKIVAIICVEKEEANTILNVKKWASSKLPLYMLPSSWKIVAEIPRNAMGKINKIQLIQQMTNQIQCY